MNEMGALLAPGRISPSTRAVLTDALTKRTVDGDAGALKQALKLISMAPEFHSSNKLNAKASDRKGADVVESQNRPYKAIVVVMLNGGADSYNMVVPHSNCTISRHSSVEHDLHAEYLNVRGDLVGIPKEDLLPIDVKENSSPQPCRKFGLHPSLSFLQESFVSDKDTIVLGNVGGMAEPMTQAEFYSRSKAEPLGNFGHDAMRRAASSLDAVNKRAKGILGKMVAKVSSSPQSMKSALYSTTGQQKILEGSSVPLIVKRGVGVLRYAGYNRLKTGIKALHGKKSRSIFAETFSSSLESSLEVTEKMGALLSEQNLVSDAVFPSGVGADLKEVSKLIALDTTQLNTERAGFIVSQFGYDTHNTADISGKLDELDGSLEAFAKEIKAQGLWDNVTILLVSDFGRTLTDKYVHCRVGVRSGMWCVVWLYILNTCLGVPLCQCCYHIISFELICLLYSVAVLLVALWGPITAGGGIIFYRAEKCEVGAC